MYLVTLLFVCLFGVLVLLAFARVLRNHSFRRSLKRQVEHFVSNPPPSPFAHQRVLIIVNPFGGNGLNRDVYELALRPMLQATGVRHDVHFTQRRREAVELLRRAALERYAALVFLSGDTTFNEGLEGIFEQLGRDEARFERALSTLRFALLPGGTSNTLAVSLDRGDIFTSIASMLTGRVRAIDVMKIVTDGEGEVPAELRISDPHTFPNHTATTSSTEYYVRYNPMSFGWGLIGTHDIYQEHTIRWMEQTLKSFAAPLLAILANERFTARLSYRDAHTGQWVNVPHTRFIMAAISSIPKVATDICLSTTLAPDDGCLVFDYIPAHASIAQVVGVFLAFDVHAGHLAKYGNSVYLTHLATEVKLEMDDGYWTNAGHVLRNKRLHARVLRRVLNVLC